MTCTRCSNPIEEPDVWDYAGDPHCESCYTIIHEMVDMCRYDDIENPFLDQDHHDDSSHHNEES